MKIYHKYYIGKLNLENISDDVTGITLFHKPTGSEVETSVDIGTASEVNINETGTYRAEIKAVSSYTFTEPVVIPSIVTTAHRLESDIIEPMSPTEYYNYGSDYGSIAEFLFNESSPIDPTNYFVHLKQINTFTFNMNHAINLSQIRIYAGNTTPNWGSRNTGSIIKFYNKSASLLYTSESLSFSRSSPEWYYGPYEEGYDFNTLTFETPYDDVQKIEVVTPSTSASLGRVELIGTLSGFLRFDGFNKLTIENISDDVTGITLYHKPTGSEVETSVDIGTASTVNINETGTYRAEIKAVSSYTFTETVVVASISTKYFDNTWDFTKSNSLTSFNSDNQLQSSLTNPSKIW